jgi:excisionase family DNA binding protein
MSIIPPDKAVFTTGEAARICNISQQTIIRNFDTGRLRGFRVPGSKFRRIPRSCLVEFMREHRIPLGDLEHATRRVLVIDDEPDVVEMLRDLLTQNGRFEVKTGSNGFEAGMLARQFQPDVILLDFKLPDINGTAVCRTVRAEPELAHTKIIIISGVATREEVDELMNAGADAFVKKPFTIKQVLEKISELTVV